MASMVLFGAFPHDSTPCGSTCGCAQAVSEPPQLCLIHSLPFSRFVSHLRGLCTPWGYLPQGGSITTPPLIWAAVQASILLLASTPRLLFGQWELVVETLRWGEMKHQHISLRCHPQGLCLPQDRPVWVWALGPTDPFSLSLSRSLLPILAGLSLASPSLFGFSDFPSPVRCSQFLMLN